MTISNVITPTTEVILIVGDTIGSTFGFRFDDAGEMIPESIPDLEGNDLNYFYANAITELQFTTGSVSQIGTYDTCWVTIEGMGRRKLTWDESSNRYRGYWSDTFTEDMGKRLGKMLRIKFELMDP